MRILRSLIPDALLKIGIQLKVNIIINIFVDNTSVRLALSDRYHCYQSTYENRYRWKTGCLFIYHTYWCMIFFISTYNTYNIFTFYSTYYANEWRYHESYRQVCCAGYRGPDCQRAYTAHL